MSANFSTRNIERPEDFVDLRVGIRPLMVPAFAEDSNAAVSMNGQDFIPSLGAAPIKYLIEDPHISLIFQVYLLFSLQTLS